MIAITYQHITSHPVFKFLTDPSLPFDMFRSSTQTLDACLADGRFLVERLEEAMLTGVPATVDFDQLIVPVNRDLFERYNRDLARLKQLKELIVGRDVDFQDFMAFRLGCNSLPRVEPLFTLYKSMYYYHTIIWFALFPRDRVSVVCCFAFFHSSGSAFSNDSNKPVSDHP